MQVRCPTRFEGRPVREALRGQPQDISSERRSRSWPGPPPASFRNQWRWGLQRWPSQRRGSGQGPAPASRKTVKITRSSNFLEGTWPTATSDIDTVTASCKGPMSSLCRRSRPLPVPGQRPSPGQRPGPAQPPGRHARRGVLAVVHDGAARAAEVLALDLDELDPANRRERLARYDRAS